MATKPVTIRRQGSYAPPHMPLTGSAFAKATFWRSRVSLYRCAIMTPPRSRSLGEAFLSAALPIAGFALIEAADLQAAIEIASNSPCAIAQGVVEVWPLELPPAGI